MKTLLSILGNLSKFGHEIHDKIIDYKGGALLATGPIWAFLTNFYIEVSQTSIMGVSAKFLILIAGLMLIDWIFGVKASMKEGKRFESGRVIYTIIKFLTLFLWLWLSREIGDIYNGNIVTDITINFISIFVLILVALREFVSIGENIETIYGKKPYMFELVDVLFTAIERKFKNKINDN